MKTLIALIFFSSATVLFSQVNQEWIQRYNCVADTVDAATSITVDGSGNVYVTGYSYGVSSNDDFLTIKYNSAGSQLWEARYNGPGNASDRASAIAIDASGNVYVSGESVGSGTSFDYATIKYNSSGVQEWTARYNGPGNNSDWTNSLAIDGSGNVYVTGESIGSGTNRDYATIKYNSSGTQQWLARYSSPGNNADYGFSIALDGSGNVYVTGKIGLGGTNSDCVTIKYNSSGAQQWVATYNGPGNSSDWGNSIVLDNAGNIYVTGESSGGIYSDYATIKYDASGSQQWAARYNGQASSVDIATSIVLDGSGNVYITGESYVSSNNFFDYATIKYNTSGVQQWVATYSGTQYGNDVPSAIALDGSGNVYVTGLSMGSGSGNDYVTIKYSQAMGIQQIGTEVPDAFSLSQNYPNPFNPVTNIEFTLPEATFVKIVVYNITGQEIETLVNQNMTAGSYKADWNASKYSSGVYFYTIQAGDFNYVKKMILCK